MLGLNRNCFDALQECMGGPYRTAELRLTCSQLSKYISKPPQSSMKKLVKIAARTGDISLTEFCLKIKNDIRMVWILYRAAEAEKFDYCDNYRPRLTPNAFVELLVSVAIRTGNGHPLLDVVMPRYGWDFKLVREVMGCYLFNCINNYENVQVMDAVVNSGAANLDETAIYDLGSSMPFEYSLKFARTLVKNSDKFTLLQSVSSKHSFSEAMQMLEVLGLDRVKAFNLLYEYFLLVSFKQNFVLAIHKLLGPDLDIQMIVKGFVSNILCNGDEAVKMYMDEIIPEVSRDRPELLEMIKEALLLWHVNSGGLNESLLKRYCPEHPDLKPKSICAIS